MPLAFSVEFLEKTGSDGRKYERNRVTGTPGKRSARSASRMASKRPACRAARSRFCRVAHAHDCGQTNRVSFRDRPSRYAEGFSALATESGIDFGLRTLLGVAQQFGKTVDQAHQYRRRLRHLLQPLLQLRESLGQRQLLSRGLSRRVRLRTAQEFRCRQFGWLRPTAVPAVSPADP